MKILDVENWPRKEQYRFFSGMDYPHYNICFNVDITAMVSKIKEKSLPFYYTMIYLSVQSANQVEEFRCRELDGKVVIYDELHPSFTDMDTGSDLFKIVAVQMKSDVQKFTELAQRTSRSQNEFFVPSDYEGRSDYLYITSIPWVSFTHISHTINLKQKDSTPRLSWGKYFSEGDRIMLPYSVQVNHAFVDGIHIGKFKTALNQVIAGM